MTAKTPVILVVDDIEDNRFTLTRRLRHEGFEHIVEAANGREALERLEADAIDLVLLDIMMPEVDGFEVLKRMKADTRLRDIAVIVVSASEELEGIVKAVQLGAEDYIPKPFNPVLLKARIDASLARRRLRDQENAYLARIEEERRRADRFLRAILPDEALRELKATDRIRPRRFADVAILFCDIVGFTPWCEDNAPEVVVEALGRLVERFEEITHVRGLEKLKTVGDAFIATAGLLRAVDNPVLACVQAGHDMVAAARDFEPCWQIRVGIHQGPVVAGIMGRRQFQFDLWGDAVNTAARITDAGEPGTVTVAGDTWLQIRHDCRGRSRGPIALKGKGDVELIEIVAEPPGR
ncbi:MAG TPA: adenylate/guanylate cyclase domain-containing protein [Reyranella sp.]|nr:adenylate/guanylate cyclase domain-containing protein [Reyranella sp.]